MGGLLMTILYLLTFACGVALGGFIVYNFNPSDVTINGKNKVKRGGHIDFTPDIKVEKPKKEKIKLFTKFKNRRKRK